MDTTDYTPTPYDQLSEIAKNVDEDFARVVIERTRSMKNSEIVVPDDIANAIKGNLFFPVTTFDWVCRLYTALKEIDESGELDTTIQALYTNVGWLVPEAITLGAKLDLIIRDYARDGGEPIELENDFRYSNPALPESMRKDRNTPGNAATIETPRISGLDIND